MLTYCLRYRGLPSFYHLAKSWSFDDRAKLRQYCGWLWDEEVVNLLVSPRGEAVGMFAMPR